MAYKIAVASGKGGTGKTTLSVTLFNWLRQSKLGKVQLIDCDVEEPNDALFFGLEEEKLKTEVNQLVPEIDTEKCVFCRKCAEYCEFNAITIIPPVEFAEVNASLCHSCGACIVACEHEAIYERPEKIGDIRYYDLHEEGELIEGRLKIGSAMQTMLIKELKNKSGDADIVIYDAPPGTSCPVVETINDADFVVLVTEPTPFGVYDFKLMYELVQDLGKSFGVVINKSGLGNHEIYDFIASKQIEIIGEIPFNKEYARLYANGILAEEIPKEVADAYTSIVNKLRIRISTNTQ